jgi:uroporphyrinogen decarboxylase
MDFGFWEETLPIWTKYGLPEGVNPDDFFGMDAQWAGSPVNVWLHPGFEWTVLEDRGDTLIVRDGDGVTLERGKYMGSIPRHLDHTLKDRASWEKEIKWRLNGKDPARRWDWDKFLAGAMDSNRDYPISINAGSLYGKLRDIMSVEHISMIVYDDRALFEEMVETVADCIIDSITPALESGVKFDYASMWEDMCYKAGPLLSPKVFKQVLVPHYKRITGLLRKYGVDVVMLDCDGDISFLVPLWLDGGVNCMFPIEVGTWGADPVAYRKQYGRDLLMVGGVSKRLLAGSKEGITREVKRLAPLVEEGGYIPLPDHRVPPDVSLDNYMFYLREARRVWGKDMANLRPMHELNTSAPCYGKPYDWK